MEFGLTYEFSCMTLNEKLKLLNFEKLKPNGLDGLGLKIVTLYFFYNSQDKSNRILAETTGSGINTPETIKIFFFNIKNIYKFYLS